MYKLDCNGRDTWALNPRKCLSLYKFSHVWVKVIESINSFQQCFKQKSLIVDGRNGMKRFKLATGLRCIKCLKRTPSFKFNNDNNNETLIKHEPLVYTRARRAVQKKKKEG